MKLKQYIYEFLFRNFLILVCSILNAIIVYYYNKEVFYCIGQYQQIDIPEFISTELTEIFTITIKLTIFLAIYCSYIYFIYNYWSYINPGLYKFESNYFTNYIKILLGFYFILTYLLYNYGFYIIYEFFTQFEYIEIDAPIKLKTTIKLSENINLLINFVTTFSLNLHFGLILITLIQKFNINLFITKRKFFYFLFLLFTILLSPMDLISILLIYFVQLIIFELYIFLIYIKNIYWANSEI